MFTPPKIFLKKFPVRIQGALAMTLTVTAYENRNHPKVKEKHEK